MLFSKKCFFLFFSLHLSSQVKSSQDLKKQIFEDALAVWQSFRDPDTGVWCDTLRFNQVPLVQCGPNNNFYSSAGTGMGLVSDAIATELGRYTLVFITCYRYCVFCSKTFIAKNKTMKLYQFDLIGICISKDIFLRTRVNWGRFRLKNQFQNFFL